MASGNVTSKSQLKNVRIPHDVLDDMESVKMAGESTTSFIITAMEAEIARRQLKESEDDKLLTSLTEALTAFERIEVIGKQAGENLQAIIEIAKGEVERRRSVKA